MPLSLPYSLAWEWDGQSPIPNTEVKCAMQSSRVKSRSARNEESSWKTSQACLLPTLHLQGREINSLVEAVIGRFYPILISMLANLPKDF